MSARAALRARRPARRAARRLGRRQLLDLPVAEDPVLLLELQVGEAPHRLGRERGLGRLLEELAVADASPGRGCSRPALRSCRAPRACSSASVLPVGIPGACGERARARGAESCGCSASCGRPHRRLRLGGAVVAVGEREARLVLVRLQALAAQLQLLRIATASSTWPWRGHQGRRAARARSPIARAQAARSAARSRRSCASPPGASARTRRTARSARSTSRVQLAQVRVRVGQALVVLRLQAPGQHALQPADPRAQCAASGPLASRARPRAASIRARRALLVRGREVVRSRRDQHVLEAPIDATCAARARSRICASSLRNSRSISGSSGS